MSSRRQTRHIVLIVLYQANKGFYILQQRDFEDLLKPSQFDWADDVEEELMADAGSESSVSSCEMGEDMSSFPELERQPSSHGHDRATEKGKGFDEVFMVETQEDTGSTPGPLIVNGAMGGPVEPDTDSDLEKEIDRMEGDISREFAYRERCLADHDGEIHHFNWLGCPVYGYSSTPPVISLLFLLADPKVSVRSDEWRISSIMQRAMVFVDPVVVYLGDCRWKDLCLRGYDLVKWATGRTYKFYSRHGYWQDDERDMEENNAIDDGNLVTYSAEHLAVSNGFIQQFTIRSRAQWYRSRDERFDLAYHGHRRSICKDYKPSPLRQSMSPDDIEEEADAELERTAEIEIERPISRLSRKRPLDESFCSQFGDLRKRFACDNDDSDSDTSSDEDIDVEYPAVDNCIDSSDEEQEKVVLLGIKWVEKATFEPALNTIIEEEEPTQEDENDKKGHHHRVSSGTQTLCGPSGSNTALQISNERQMKDAGAQTDSVPYDASGERKSKWKKKFSRISNKARHTLRPKDAQFSLASESSDFSEPTPSSSMQPQKGTNSHNTEISTTVVSDDNLAESPNMRLSERYNLATPHFVSIRNGNETPSHSSPKKLATKVKRIFRRSSNEHTTSTPPKKRSSFSESAKDFFYDGIWAMKSYPLVMT